MSSIRSDSEAPTISALRPSFSPVTIIVGSALVAAAAIAWIWLLSSPMGGGGMASQMAPVQPWSGSYLFSAAGMWTVMMIAMMAPSAGPMVLLHARIDRSLSTTARIGQTLVFTSSYLLVWTAFSIAAAMVQAGAVALGIIASASLAIRTPALGSAVLLFAAAYELTMAKQQCLSKCQSPLLFLYRHYRPGVAGAFRTGILHGLYCLGCCWVLMLLLFLGGVMNLAWVAILGVAIIGEKQAPAEWHANRWIAGLLAVAALAILIRPWSGL